MKWKPMINPGDDRIIDYLSEIESKRIQKLEEEMVNAPLQSEKLKIEKKILDIYLEAIERNKNKKRTLGDWLNEAELTKVKQLREQLIHSDNPFYYEAMIYEVYLESICRQSDFAAEAELRTYIKSMKETKSNNEAERLAKAILDLLRTAGQ